MSEGIIVILTHSTWLRAGAPKDLAKLDLITLGSDSSPKRIKDIVHREP